MESVNPATGDRIESYERDSDEDVEYKLETATDTFREWRERPLRDREKLLASVADVLRTNKERYATVMTREVGKPVTQARAEVEKFAWTCDHYAEYAGTYLSSTHHPSPPGTDVKTLYEPLGPVLAVMPWNFPFWQVMRFAAPYVTAGNVGLLKHASNVPGCAQLLEDIFREAGYPEGVFQTLMIGSDRVESVVEDDRVRAVTLTGSGPAGRAVAETAGKNLKKTVLELGGSDPFIVLDIAAKRFIVHEDIYDEYVEQLVTAFESQTIGDPLKESTEIGPQADPSLMAELHKQVTTSVEAGAELRTGGEPLDRKGAFYPPTVLTDVPDGCPVDSEETFGPVAAVYEVSSVGEAITLANDTRFGLGASIWTADRSRGERVAKEVDAGCVYVNQLTKSDPRVPFGGIGDSGHGRELAGPGMREFVNRKTVWTE